MSCHYCHIVPALHTCAQCLTTHYCSTLCHKRDWVIGNHGYTCTTIDARVRDWFARVEVDGKRVERAYTQLYNAAPYSKDYQSAMTTLRLIEKKAHRLRRKNEAWAFLLKLVSNIIEDSENDALQSWDMYLKKTQTSF